MRDSPPRKRARSLTACTSPSAPLGLERGQPEHQELARQGAAQVALEGLALDRGQEADPAVVDADHRRARARPRAPAPAGCCRRRRAPGSGPRRPGAARMPSPDENGARMRCLTTSPAGTSTSTPASWRIESDGRQRRCGDLGLAVGEEQHALDRTAGVLDRDRDAAAVRGLGAHRRHRRRRPRARTSRGCPSGRAAPSRPCPAPARPPPR